ncbi:MAG: Gfo/Idh/MocA family protein [Gemmatimonadota bacterium]
MKRIAVLGLGNAGTTLHLPALRALPGVEIVGGCDTDPQHRERAGRKFGIPVHEDFGALLSSAAPDAVIVGTPPATHEDAALQALEAGADVICEKPIAPTVEAADRMLASAARNGRRLAVNHEFRVMPIFEALADELGAAETGELVFLQAWQSMDLPPWAEPGWRGELLNGTLFEAGIHLVDYALFLFGESPVTVSATTSTCGVRDTDSDSVALVTLEFSRGRLAHIVQNRLCKGDTQYFDVRADAERASLRASFGGRVRLSLGLLRSVRPHVRLENGRAGVAWREVADRRVALARNPSNPAMRATRDLIGRTLEAFRTGGPAPADGEAGRAALAVVAACYESARSGRKVVLA